MATTPRKTAASNQKPRTAARAASRPPTSRAVQQEEDFGEPDVTEADAQEAEANDRYVTGDLCGEEVRIIPPGAWRQSWQRLLNQGQIDAFAQKVLHPDDYEVYEDVDPTNDEFGDLINDAVTRAGESLGKSRGPAESSRRTRRR